jgi:hypothetical protein
MLAGVHGDDATRGAADQASADEARQRLREQGIVPIEPDERIGVLLAPGELLVAVRPGAGLDRRQRCRDDDAGVAGDLYLTSRRLVHLGCEPVAYDLDEIREAVVAGSRLLLVMGDNRGVVIGVGDPLHLRVEIAAARAASRDAGRGGQAPSR